MFVCIFNFLEHARVKVTCMQYGMGLMRLPFIYKAVGTAGCAASPSDCICDSDGSGCSVVIQLHGKSTEILLDLLANILTCNVAWHVLRCNSCA